MPSVRSRTGYRTLVQTDALINIRVVEGLDQRPLLLTGDRVHFEVASNEEFTSHYVIYVYLTESEVDLLEGCGR